MEAFYGTMELSLCAYKLFFRLILLTNLFLDLCTVTENVKAFIYFICLRYQTLNLPFIHLFTIHLFKTRS